ncbi:hypothetical protein [Frigidibacter sp. MR17.14]|uniref:hypothetical protein n=1 Tax=Frigidibacter sp. MR17.14 TaxID=3126509 RepID=UPI0030130C80
MELTATDWVAFTPEADCLLQVRRGEVEIETAEDVEERFGVVLRDRQALSVAAGKTIYLRDTRVLEQYGPALIAWAVL